VPPAFAETAQRDAASFARPRQAAPPTHRKTRNRICEIMYLFVRRARVDLFRVAPQLAKPSGLSRRRTGRRAQPRERGGDRFGADLEMLPQVLAVVAAAVAVVPSVTMRRQPRRNLSATTFM